MGSQAQARAFFALWWINFSWILRAIWAFLTLFFLFPAAGVARSVLTAGVNAASATFGLAALAFHAYLVFGDFLAGLLWLFLQFAFPLCWTLVNLVLGIDIPGIAATLFRYLWRILLFVAIFGTIVAVYTWWGNQNETQQFVDAAYCQIIPLQEPFCNLYNLLADFYETFIPAINTVLDITYDFLEMVFEGLVRLLFTGFSLLVRFFADPIGGSTACTDLNLFSSRQPFCVSSGTPLANNQCVIREFFCWWLDVFNFFLMDVFGGVLRLFFGNTVANFALQAIWGYVQGLGLAVDLAASVINPTALLPCNGASLSLNSTASEAKACFSDRTRCVLNRSLCFVLFWLRILWGSAEAFCEFIFAAFDVLFFGVFNGIGDLLKRLFTVLPVVIDILEDPIGFVTDVFNVLIVPFSNLLNATVNLLNVVRGQVLGIIYNPVGTIYNFPGVILGLVQSAPLGFAQAISSQISSLLGIQNLWNAINALRSVVNSLSSGGGLFGRRLLAVGTAGTKDWAVLPLIYGDELIQKGREATGYSHDEAMMMFAGYEIANNAIRRECGVSDYCADLLSSYEGVPNITDISQDNVLFDENLFCVNQYAKTRAACQTRSNQTTWPDYHIETGSTWLPDDDECKPVLERDMFAHLGEIEVEQEEHFDAAAWWWETYSTCATLYYTSFGIEYKRHINGSRADHTLEGDMYYYERPETFSTAQMSDPHFKHDMGVFIRLMILPHRNLPASPEDGVGYRLLRHAQHIRAWFVEYDRKTSIEHQAQRQKEAYADMYKSPTPIHTIGEYSMYADKVDKKGNIVPGLGTMIKPVHDRMGMFSWKTAFTSSFQNWRNETHQAEIRKNPVKMSLTTMAQWAGGMPRVHRTHTYRPWRHVSGASMGRRLLSLVPRDFNFNDIIRQAGAFIADFFIFIFSALSALLRILGLPGFEQVADAVDFIINVIATFDYATLLDTLFDFILSYISDLISSLDCSAPDWYDARDAPDAPWKCQCLLMLKLPPLLPRWPDFTQIVIPWGSPCKGDVGVCGWDGSFPALEIPGNLFEDVPFPLVDQLPCPAGYCDCAEIGFTDGFDILIYFVELISIETGVDVIGVLRSDELGLVVGLGLNILAVALYPFGLIFGFTSTLNDLIGVTSLRDVPYVGPVVFRFADFSELPNDAFYDFCIGWGYALALLPLLITVFLFIAFGYYLVETPALLLAFLNLLFRAFILPFGALVLADTERFKERWDDPVWVYEQEEGLYDNEFGAISYAPKGGSEVEALTVAETVFSADTDLYNR